MLYQHGDNFNFNTLLEQLGRDGEIGYLDTETVEAIASRLIALATSADSMSEQSLKTLAEIYPLLENYQPVIFHPMSLWSFFKGLIGGALAMILLPFTLPLWIELVVPVMIALGISLFTTHLMAKRAVQNRLTRFLTYLDERMSEQLINENQYFQNVLAAIDKIPLLNSQFREQLECLRDALIKAFRHQRVDRQQILLIETEIHQLMQMVIVRDSKNLYPKMIAIDNMLRDAVVNHYQFTGLFFKLALVVCAFVIVASCVSTFGFVGIVSPWLSLFLLKMVLIGYGADFVGNKVNSKNITSPYSQLASQINGFFNQHPGYQFAHSTQAFSADPSLVPTNIQELANYLAQFIAENTCIELENEDDIVAVFKATKTNGLLDRLNQWTLEKMLMLPIDFGQASQTTILKASFGVLKRDSGETLTQHDFLLACLERAKSELRADEFSQLVCTNEIETETSPRLVC